MIWIWCKAFLTRCDCLQVNSHLVVRWSSRLNLFNHLIIWMVIALGVGIVVVWINLLLLRLILNLSWQVCLVTFFSWQLSDLWSVWLTGCYHFDVGWWLFIELNVSIEMIKSWFSCFFGENVGGLSRIS
jgi:hypothetical protein